MKTVFAGLLLVSLVVCFGIAAAEASAGAYDEAGLGQLAGWAFKSAYFHSLFSCMILLFVFYSALVALFYLSGTVTRAIAGAAAALAVGAGLAVFVDRVFVPGIDPATLPFFAKTPEGMEAFFLRALKTKMAVFLEAEEIRAGFVGAAGALWLGFVGIGWILQLAIGRLLRLPKKPERSPEKNRRWNKIAWWSMGTACGAWILVSAAVALANPIEPATATPERPNVVLISIDTLRPDRLGCYGGPAENSPNLDRLADTGLLFEYAAAPSPWTLPSHAALVTGIRPALLGVTGVAQTVPERSVTIAERLKAAGYETAGFYTHLFVSSSYGFDQGFDRYIYVPSERAKDVVDRGLAELSSARQSGRALFLFLHLFDPHWPYDAPDGNRVPATGENAERIERLAATEDFYDFAQGVVEGGPDVARYFLREYDREIRYVDAELGRLLARVDFNNTLVVILSDHGEEFLDHGFVGHSITLYDEVLRVPLILRGPGIAQGRVTDRTASITGVAAEIARRTGVAYPGDMARPVTDDVPEDLFAETALGGPMRVSVRSPDGMKLIEPYKASYRAIAIEHGEELYDLATDPGERNDLSSDEIAARDGLRHRIVTYRESVRAASPETSSRELDAETIERLKALGYL